MWKRILAFCLIATLCTGCGRRRNPAEEDWPVVSMITVTSHPEGQERHLVYTNQDKMRQILNGLRTLGQKTSPDVNPDDLPLQGHTIAFAYTDGSQRIYQTKGGRYIRRVPGPWQQADPKKVTELDTLLQTLPADGHTVDTASFSSIRLLHPPLQVYHKKSKKACKFQSSRV